MAMDFGRGDKSIRMSNRHFITRFWDNIPGLTAFLRCDKAEWEASSTILERFEKLPFWVLYGLLPNGLKERGTMEDAAFIRAEIGRESANKGCVMRFLYLRLGGY